MDLEQRLRASLVAPNPGAVFTARVMARLGRGAARRRSSFILIGTVLMVGAAAAMLAWRMSAVQPLQVENAAIAAAPGPGPIAEEPVQAKAGVSEPVEAARKAGPPTDMSPQYSVLVIPLRQEAQDVSKRGRVEAFYAAVLDELRKVSGIALRVSADSELGDGDQADFVLTITGLASSVSQAGGVVTRSTDGATTYTVQDGGIVAIARNGSGGTVTGSTVSKPSAARELASALWVEMTVESRRSAAARKYTVPVGAEDTAEHSCKSQIAQLRIPDCMTPAQQAATQVEVLRLEVFPPDSAFQQSVLARLSDTPSDQAGQLQVTQVLQRVIGEGGSRLDPGTIQALVRYAADQSARMRAIVWATLRWAKASHPALVEPLLESLRHDPDQEVRLAALVNLEANYSTIPVVHGALETVAQEEADPILRVAVRRVLYGQTQWRDELLAALHADLPYEARLAPLFVSGPALSPRQLEYRRAALQEQEILRPLVTLLLEHLRDSDHAKATSYVLGLLGNVDDPAVFDLFMPLLRETSMLDREITVRANRMDASGPVTAWVARNRNDPRVIASLRDADPRLRTMFEPKVKSMEMTVPPAMVEPMVPDKLIERMRELTEKPASPAPLTQ